MQTALYKITNDVNDKVYIGVTMQPSVRWADHMRAARKGKQNKLYNAIRKHGAKSFSMQVLHWCDTRDDAYELEQFVIDVIGSIDGGYNTTPGGRGLGAGEQHPHYGKARPPEVIEKMRAARVGTKRSQGEKERISASLKLSWVLSPRPAPSPETRRKIGMAGIGREVTAETRAKISAGLTGFKRPPMTDTTKQKLSAIFTGVKHTPEAVEKIRAASLGRKYPNRKPQSPEARRRAAESASATRTKNAKNVVCVETGEVFQSARLAARACGVSEATVSMHCKGKISGGKPKKGYTFRYEVK